MNDFWTWFNKKYSIESIILEGVKTGIGNIPEQMLIGYMIEYLNDNNFSYNIFSLPVDHCYVYLKSIACRAAPFVECRFEYNRSEYDPREFVSTQRRQ